MIDDNENISIDNRDTSVDLAAGRSVNAPAVAGIVLALLVIGVLGWLVLSRGSSRDHHQEEVELVLVDGMNQPELHMHQDAVSVDELIAEEATNGVDREAVDDPKAARKVGPKFVPDVEEETEVLSAPNRAADTIDHVRARSGSGEKEHSPTVNQAQRRHLETEVRPEMARKNAQLAQLDPGLLQQTRRGPLPIIGADGREPWQVYARPSQAGPAQPRLAIVVVGLGLSSSAVETAMALSGAVTLSFTPYAPMLEKTVEEARSAGHEVLMDLPMEPVSYPADDPGPHTLLTSLNPTDNIARLEWLLGRFSGYVGVISHMGSRFTTSPEALRPVMTALRDRGLMFVDSRASNESVAANVAAQLALPFAINSIFVDHEPTRAAIDRTFTELESRVLQTGTSIAIARAFPVTLERLAVWLPALEERGIVLVPASALAERQ